MDHAIGFGLKAAGALEDDVDFIFAPLQIVGVLFPEDRDFVALENEIVLDDVAVGVLFDFGADFVLMPASMGGVVLKEIGKGLRVDEIVDGDDFESAFFVSSAESEAPDASESVNG
jgi:hypothetical protein